MKEQLPNNTIENKMIRLDHFTGSPINIAVRLVEYKLTLESFAPILSTDFKEGVLNTINDFSALENSDIIWYNKDAEFYFSISEDYNEKNIVDIKKKITGYIQSYNNN